MRAPPQMKDRALTGGAPDDRRSWSEAAEETICVGLWSEMLPKRDKESGQQRPRGVGTVPALAPSDIRIKHTKKEGDQSSRAPEQETVDPISSLKDLMVAIQSPKTEVIHKLDAVAVEVNLLRAHLHKVSDREHTAEQDSAALQVKVGLLRMAISDLQNLTTRLDERAEDSGGRSRRKTSTLWSFRTEKRVRLRNYSWKNRSQQH
ncbi:hypothetical protein NDU88_003524 [Pleurodeles waltl]|uniref:Uncharacterized protein n=1 Tax=Pleurodeles waltl TaxID=8319 RepID=A0AAV7MRW1_PLEWA|nr:hypothetical protein NDU88_003524 [Pleurodeles waltl]